MSESKPKPFTPTQERIGDVVVKAMTKLHVWIFRASKGRLGNKFLRGAPVCLVTSIGRKSGNPRTIPLLYLEDEDRIILVASKAGMSKHPVWYLNMEANPEVEVEIGSERRKMLARRASDEEKAALWPRLVEMYRDYADYQARTDRNIPVLILSPR